MPNVATFCRFDVGNHSITFLTLPLIPVSTIRRQNTSTPIIDFSRSWNMTSDEYLAQLHHKAKLKDEVNVERSCKEEKGGEEQTQETSKYTKNVILISK